MDYADSDLIAAIVKPCDHLKARAEARLAKGPLTVPFSVGIELLFVARKFGKPCVDFLGAASRYFTLERLDVLLAAAEALDTGEVGTVFDAVHGAAALVDGAVLWTTDGKVLGSGFPARRF